MKIKLDEDLFDNIEVVTVEDGTPGDNEKAPSGPPVGIETTIANEIIDNINGEWDTIHNYNNMISDLKQAGLDSFVPVINDISNEEHKHIGQLQELLKQISPNTESIQSGETEAEGQLTESYIQEKDPVKQAKDIREYIKDFLNMVGKKNPSKFGDLKKAAAKFTEELESLSEEDFLGESLSKKRTLRESAGIKQFDVSSPEYERLEKLAAYLTEMSPNGYHYYVGDTYFNFGQGRKWTTVLVKSPSSSWQALNPDEQERAIFSSVDSDLREIAKEVLSDKYCPDKYRG